MQKRGERICSENQNIHALHGAVQRQKVTENEIAKLIRKNIAYRLEKMINFERQKSHPPLSLSVRETRDEERKKN